MTAGYISFAYEQPMLQIFLRRLIEAKIHYYFLNRGPSKMLLIRASSADMPLLHAVVHAANVEVGVST